MSLLGPDDFDLSAKERKKKLARDLSPEVYKQIERWIEREDDSEFLERTGDLLGPEEAEQLMAKLKRGKKLQKED